MARTKASIAAQDNPGVSSAGKSKTDRQKKKKDKVQKNDTVKKKTIKKEESESEDSDEQSRSLPQFHKGTTWPLDANLEVHVHYEGVKEVRTIKPPFLPILYQLTRGEPESIAKAITSIKPVHQILKERIEKECNPAVMHETDKKPPSVNLKSVDLATLKKIPSQHFRDAKGKWLPKRKWKFAEIVKNKPKLQSLISQRTGISDANQATNTGITDEGHQGTRKKLTLLADARSAIEDVLSRVCMRRQEYAKLIVWLRSLEMKSCGKSNTQKSVRPWRNKLRSTARSKHKDVKKADVVKTEADARSDNSTNLPIKKAMYGLEKSSIINSSRLRNKPKYMPYIPPKNLESKQIAEVTPKTRKQNVVPGRHSGSEKSLPQQSEPSKSLSQQTGSSRGFSVLFKGRTFSSGKKFFFNNKQNVQSESDSEDDEGENYMFSTDSRKAKARRHSKDGFESTEYPNPVKEKSKSQQKFKQAKPSTSKLQESSPSSGSEEESGEEETSAERQRDLKPSSALYPQVRVPLVKLSDAAVSSSQQQDSPPNIIQSAEGRQMGAKNEGHQDSQNNFEGRTYASCSGNKSKLKRTIIMQESELDDKPVSKKSKIQMVKDNGKLQDNEKEERRLEEENEMTGMQNEAEIEDSLTPESPLYAEKEEDDSGKEYPPPEVHIENLEGEDNMVTCAEVINLEDMETGEAETAVSSEPIIIENTATQSTGEEWGSNSSNIEKPSVSSSKPQTSNTEDTLRLLISHLSNMRDSEGEAVDCRILFSNANQVLTISGVKNPSLNENPQSEDTKPIINQREPSENSDASTSDHINRASPDTSNQVDNSESAELQVLDVHEEENMESNESGLKIISSETLATVKQEWEETEGKEAEFKNQKEADAIIIIDD